MSSDKKHDKQEIDEKFIDDGEGLKVTKPMHMSKKQVESFTSAIDKILAEDEQHPVIQAECYFCTLIDPSMSLNCGIEGGLV